MSENLKDETMDNQQAQAFEVIQQIKDEWSENWDMLIDFLGQDIADKLDKIKSKASTTTKGHP